MRNSVQVSPKIKNMLSSQDKKTPKSQVLTEEKKSEGEE